jgi:hypothetical protein
VGEPGKNSYEGPAKEKEKDECEGGIDKTVGKTYTVYIGKDDFHGPIILPCAVIKPFVLMYFIGELPV